MKNQFKKLVVMIIILYSIFRIIPNVNIQNVIEGAEEKINIEEIDILSSRGTEEETRESIKNLNLTTESNLRELSNLTEDDYFKILESYPYLQGIESALVQAEQDYNVNGLYLLGLACEESAYGTHHYATKRNNLCGISAYDSNPDNASTFKSKSSCILFVAKLLDEHYLTEGADCFEGYTPRAIDVHYCSDKRHADKIVDIVNQNLIEKL